MASVTAFTAARMLAMEAATIVDGEVVGNNLILTRHDSTTIDAGSVRGPTGSPGVSESEFLEQIERICPAATVRMTFATVADPGWILLNGHVEVACASNYPALWSKVPAVYKTGNDFHTPDMTSSFPIGGTPGTGGGSNTKSIGQPNLPNVGIPIDPPSTTISVDPPNAAVYIDPPNAAVTGMTNSTNRPHQHGLPGDGSFVRQRAGGPHGLDINAGTGATIDLVSLTEMEGTQHEHPAGSLVVDIAPFWAYVDIGSFSATVDIAQFTSGSLGSGTPLDITPKWIAFCFQIKAH
jgi:hypothetical protein